MSSSDTLSLHKTLTYYKRADIREAMAALCRNKEVAVRYGEGFGKRPDVVIYDSDILSFAQKKATSFHITEETWTNPLQLTAGMRSSELNDLRIGWDLVIDVDFPVWEATRIITDAVIKQLLTEGVPQEAISCKFSGNKGFHVCVPFEAFPEIYVDESDVEIFTSDLFPDGVRRIIEYLVDKLDGPKNGFSLSKQLLEIPGVEGNEELLVTVNAQTGEQVTASALVGEEFICPLCGHSLRSENDFESCPKDKTFMKKISRKEPEVPTVQKVGLEIDTLLVSNRHMYRLVYSLHEKSGLASIPVPLEEVLTFSREDAAAEKVRVSSSFLSREVPRGCASQLLYNAMKHVPVGSSQQLKTLAEITWSGEAASEEAFPPPIKAMLGSLRDGRKRALFVLTNFLQSVGWSHDEIEARLNEWNKQLPDPLRDNDIISHLRYHKRKEAVLPPNFDNDMYYRDVLGDAFVHDELSASVKNPVTYVRKRMKAHKYQQSQKKSDGSKDASN
ncbi:MAG: hypothetical protein ACMXYD_04020 [Candidatus Woesearchaeota archaeon]